MSEIQLKAIISALTGAVAVLLAVYIFMFFITGSSPRRPLVVKNEMVTVQLPEKTVKEKAVSADPVDLQIDVFSNLDFKVDAENAAEVIDPAQPARIKPGKAKEEKLKPLSEDFESDELSRLEAVIDSQKSLFEEADEKPARVTDTKTEENVSVESVSNRNKTTTPDGRRLVSTDENTDSALTTLLNQGQKIFNLTTADFDKGWLKKTGAVWTDYIRTSARSGGVLEFRKIHSKETLFSFRKKRLSKISMILYNKGDQSHITERDFNYLKNESLSILNSYTGSSSQFKPNAGVVKNNIHFWIKDRVLYKLEYSTSTIDRRFAGEYMRIVISLDPGNTNVVNIDKENSDVLTESELAEMVTRSKDGDVIINGIPMVDQGSKGYCACAALARLMTYFGRDIDQHDIARLSSATMAGTDPKELKKAVETMSAKLRLNMKVLARSYLSNERDAKRLESKLNSILEANNNIKDISEVYKIMSYEDSRYKEFEKNVINSIDRGRPVSWALMLGIVPEPEIPQAAGGHMRIITGYNKISNKIYYTDTWGAGHEKKSMDMAAAFYISLAVWEISPR